MLKPLAPLLAIAMAALSATSFAQSASAPAAATSATAWEKAHPRRDQVNDRLAKQSQRIKTEVAEGDMSHRQAARLHQRDRAIRKEERRMAAHNGGYVTKSQQRALNRQENRVSAKIGK